MTKLSIEKEINSHYWNCADELKFLDTLESRGYSRFMCLKILRGYIEALPLRTKWWKKAEPQLFLKHAQLLIDYFQSKPKGK